MSKKNQQGNQRGPQIDLHGLTVEEALSRVDRFLHDISSSNRGPSLKTARIMTGKGTGTVQKAVIQYLRQAGYPWTYDKQANGKPNEGVLVLHLE